MSLGLSAFTMFARSEIKKDETVVLFPGLGSVNADGGCLLEIAGWVFEKEKRPGVALGFRRFLGLNARSMTDAENKIFADRAGYFLIDAERGKRCTIAIGSNRYNLPASDRTGHFHGTVRLSGEEFASLTGGQGYPRRVAFSVVLPRGDDRAFHGEAIVLEPQGVSVISDVDDTIKISGVGSREELLRNTFVKAFAPVDGMARVYQDWARRWDASFHYVSASPSQLYPALAAFVVTNQFPAGTFHLRPFEWKRSFFSPGSDHVRQYKVGVIQKFLTTFPARRFVLVGDAGELDPEVYGEFARRHPSQIAKIYIRVSENSDEVARHDKAFEGIPRSHWQLFTKAEEIDSGTATKQ